MNLPRCLVLITFLIVCLHSGVATAFEFRDLWQTPEQRAARQLEDGELETLIENAPDERWRGVGHYRAEDFKAAAEAFAADVPANDQTGIEASDEVQIDDSSGSPELSARVLDDMYNQATALTRAGEFDEAIRLLDQVIEQQPDVLDAQQNRSVAAALKALEEQEQQPQEGGEGESGEQGEGENGGDSDEKGDSAAGDQQRNDSEASEPSESASDSDPSSEPQSSSSNSGSDQSPQANDPGNTQESDDLNSDQIDDEAMQEAADALAAEDGSESEADNASEDEQALTLSGDDSDEPLSESDQATEQWLRRIPDDPAGLLRRKLEQSHRNDFPEVRDAQRAW